MISTILTSLLVAASFTTNRLDGLYNDDTVVTSVSFSGLATDESVQQAKQEAVKKSQEYTDSAASNIIKNIDYPVTSVNGEKGDITLTAGDVGTYGKTEIDDKIGTAVDGLASETYVNAKANAAYTGASQNATNYTDSAIGKIVIPVKSVNKKTGDVNLTSNDIGAPDGSESKNLTGYIDDSDAAILDAAVDYDSKLDKKLQKNIADTATNTLNSAKKYTDDSVDGLATEAYVNTKTLATLTAASQNATNYTDAAIGKITYPVESVNKKTGKVELTANDIGALSQNNYLSKTVYFGETSSGTFSGREGGFRVLSYAPLGNEDSGITIVSNTTYRPMGRWIADGTDVITEKKLDAKKYLTSYTETDPVFTEWRTNSTQISIGQHAEGGSVSIGYQTYATSSSVVIGNSTITSSDSVTIGTEASGKEGSVAIGYRASSPKPYTVSFLSESEISSFYSKDDRLKALYIGDYNLDELISVKFDANAFSEWKSSQNLSAGYHSSINDTASLALGAYSSATESGSIAVCGSSSGFYSIAIEGTAKDDLSITIGTGATSKGAATIAFLGEDYYQYPSVTLKSKEDRLKTFYIGDYNLDELVGDKITNAIASSSLQFVITNVTPTTVEHGKFYCFRPTSTSATAITLSPTFDNGKEDEAKLYLDYTTARSNITMADSTITVLYAPNSYKLNAFDAPNGSSNRYLVELKWFATTATEDGTSKKFLVVDAQKVSE